MSVVDAEIPRALSGFRMFASEKTARINAFAFSVLCSWFVMRPEHKPQKQHHTACNYLRNRVTVFIAQQHHNRDNQLQRCINPKGDGHTHTATKAQQANHSKRVFELDIGARLIGFVFHEKQVRYIEVTSEFRKRDMRSRMRERMSRGVFGRANSAQNAPLPRGQVCNKEALRVYTLADEKNSCAMHVLRMVFGHFEATDETFYNQAMQSGRLVDFDNWFNRLKQIFVSQEPMVRPGLLKETGQC